MKRLITCITAMATLGSYASSIILDTGSLPSTQGWDYAGSGVHAGAAETDFYSTDGSVLTADTMGQPTYAIGSSALYRQSGVVSESMPTVLEWTSRTLDHETDSTAGYYGFFVGFRTSNKDYSAGVFPDRIAIRDGSNFREIPIDATEYHTYRIETITGSLTYDFYIDGVFVTSAAPKMASFNNSLLFGDGTGHANAKSDISSLRFLQSSLEIGLSDPLNADGCIEATGPEGATVHLFADDLLASPSETYSWSTSTGDSGSGATFDFQLGVDEQAVVTLTMEDTATGASKTVTKEVCVSDTTAPEIIILSPVEGAICNGNNLGLEVQITDAVDKNIPDYLVSIGSSYVVDLDGEISRVRLFKPNPSNGPVPMEVTVTTMDASGNMASATVEVMLQHDRRTYNKPLDIPNKARGNKGNRHR